MRKIIVLVFTGLLACVQLFAGKHVQHISGSVDVLNDGDSVVVTVCPYTGRLSEFKRVFTAKAKGSRFELVILGSDKPRFVQIQIKGNNMIGGPDLLLFPGDDLDITFSQGKIGFRGRSAPVFDVQQHLKTLSDAYRQGFKIVYTPEDLPVSFGRIDLAAAIRLDYLEGRKAEIGRRAYDLLKNNLMAEAVTLKYGYVTYACLYKPREVQERFITAIRMLGKPFNGYPSFAPADSTGEPVSNFAVELVYQRYLVDSCIIAGKKFNLHDCYRFESGRFTGDMREQLVTELFMLKRNSPRLSVSDLDDALTYVKNPEFRTVLKKIRALGSVGTRAPDFLLRDADNRAIKLSDFRGKVVVLDFWFTGCGACKALAPVFFAVEKKYEHRPVVFISVSIDRSRDLWLATLGTNQYASSLALKLYTEGRGDKHHVIKDFDVHGYPTVMMIDKEGRLCPKPELDEKGLSVMIERYL